MQYFVFFICLILLGFTLTKIQFVKKSAISTRLILFLFLARVFAAVALIQINQYYSPLNDYSTLNNEGIFEFHNLIHSPAKFFTDIFYSPYQNAYGGYFNAVGSYWNDLRNNSITKLLAFLNYISRGNIYTNALLLNLLPFLASISLYRVFSSIFSDRKWIVIFGCFLIPTTLFFSSGIHKDLFVYSSLCIYSYGIFFTVTDQFTLKRFLLTFFSFLVILLMRNFLAMALIPATAGFILTNKLKVKPWKIYGSIYIIVLVLISLNSFLPDSLQPLRIITDRQAAFLELPKAHTQIELTTLNPDIQSFTNNLPEALEHGLLPTCFFSSNQWTSLFASAEWMLLFILPIILALLLRRKMQIESNFIWFGFVVAITLFIIIGYIIPNLNSIIRYKSIFLPFIITPMLYLVSLNKKRKNILDV